MRKRRKKHGDHKQEKGEETNKKRRILSGLSGAARMPLANSISKFAPINNKKYSDL